MKRILFLLAFCFLFQISFSAISLWNDSIPTKTHHLSKQDFLNNYGTDDSSRALVKYYFKRNKKAKFNAAIFTSIGVLSSFAFDRIILKNSSGGWSVIVALIIGIPLGLLIFESAIIVAFNIFRWIRFSKKNLIKQSERYRAGEALPKRIVRDRRFLEDVKAEKR